MENNFQSPMFIRLLWAHTTTVWVIWPQNTTGKQFSEPPVHQGPPPQHKQPLCGHTQPLCGYWTLKHCSNTPFRAMFIRGSPSTTPTTVWAQYKTTLWLNTTGNQLSEPHHDHGPPSQHKQPLCGHTQQLCGIFDLKTPLENNFQSPMFTKTRPPQHKQPLCG